MDGMYGLHTPSGSADYPPDRATAALIIPPDNLMTGNYSHFMNQTSSSSVKDPYYYCQYYHQQHTRLPAFGSDELISVASAISSVSTHEKQRDDDDVVLSGVKAKIASHPRYPRLLQAYIDCQKVGATPEIAYLLDEIRRENEKEDVVSSCCLGADPELDEFMDTYCDILTKYKSDLSRPFEEATEFLNQIEMQFSNICKGAFARTTSG